MKKCFLLMLCFFLFNKIIYAQKSSVYKTAVGMNIDFGSDYNTLIGISGKHFFNNTNAAEVNLNFAKGLTILGLQYQYHAAIQNAEGLKWYVGIGPSISFSKYSYYDYYYNFYSSNITDFSIRPALGLDYKVNDVPLNLAFEWSPMVQLTHGGGSAIARFGFKIRYVIK